MIKYMLKTYIANPRHLEIQLLGDHAGNVVHFGEQECSLAAASEGHRSSLASS